MGKLYSLVQVLLIMDSCDFQLSMFSTKMFRPLVDYSDNDDDVEEEEELEDKEEKMNNNNNNKEEKGRTGNGMEKSIITVKDVEKQTLH